MNKINRNTVKEKHIETNINKDNHQTSFSKELPKEDVNFTCAIDVNEEILNENYQKVLSKSLSNMSLDRENINDTDSHYEEDKGDDEKYFCSLTSFSVRKLKNTSILKGFIMEQG
jgi:hypothetical protein